MRVVGIIAEFNPFHNGHAYLIREAKRYTGASHVVILMSGNYVQRGGPAIMDQHLRTGVALANGADLVVELPFFYSMGKASVFASGAIQLADTLGCIDYLCFGSEKAGLDQLRLLADLSLTEPGPYRDLLRKNLRQGMAYSHAKELAMNVYLEEHAWFGYTDALGALLREPNHILGIEYLVALRQQKSRIQPIVIPRIDNGYHALQEKKVDGISYCSATAVRNAFLENRSYGQYVPEQAKAVYQAEYGRRYPVVEDDFSTILGYTLWKEGDSLKETVLDLSGDLWNRMVRYLPDYTSVSELIQMLNNKSTTSAYIRRALFQCILDGRREEHQWLRQCRNLPYVQVLGLNQQGAELLKHIPKDRTSIIMNPQKPPKTLEGMARQLYEKKRRADEIYRMVVQNKFHIPVPSEAELQHFNIVKQ